ncbi:MAG TPA: hypothetical protein VGZ22_04270, partial [Isosphaeraceae bacterium]|nr:hypothetical protein [Isosphaeraceae bacterium]
KPKNRLELRRQYEAAEPLDPMEDEADDAAEDSDDEEQQERKPKKKVKVATKKAVKTPKPAARMRVMWTVVNDAFKPIATFEYAQKDAAYAKAAEMTAKGKGTHFVQRVKEAMPDTAPGLGAALPRPTGEAAAVAEKPVKAAKPPKAAKVVKPPVEEEEVEDDDEDELDTEAAEEEDEEEE